MRRGPEERFPILRLAGLSAAALFIHGYHLGAEDGEIYAPAAKKLFIPSCIHTQPNSSNRMAIFRFSVRFWIGRPN